MSFGSWMFCAQRFRGLFCGGVGSLIGLGESVSTVRAFIYFFNGEEAGGAGVGGSRVYYLGYRQRFVGIDCAPQASVCGFVR